MGRFVEGADRSQLCRLPRCLDDWVEENHPVHVMEAFVDALTCQVSASAARCRRARGGRSTIDAPDPSMRQSPDPHFSLTDPDARSVATSGRGSGVVGTLCRSPSRRSMGS